MVGARFQDTSCVDNLILDWANDDYQDDDVVVTSDMWTEHAGTEDAAGVVAGHH